MDEGFRRLLNTTGYGRVLSYLLVGRGVSCSFEDIVRSTPLTSSTVEKILFVMIEDRVIIKIRKSGESHSYKLNNKLKLNQELIKTFDADVSFKDTIIKQQEFLMKEYFKQVGNET